MLAPGVGKGLAGVTSISGTQGDKKEREEGEGKLQKREVRTRHKNKERPEEEKREEWKVNEEAKI